MKAPITWVLLANSGMASIVVNKGTAKGFAKVNKATWTAEPPVEYADRAGAVRSGDSYEKAHPKTHAEELFARKVVAELKVGLSKAAYDRLIICAAPHMLGSLRAQMPADLLSLVMAEVAKDLTHVPISRLGEHLEDVIVG